MFHAGERIQLRHRHRALGIVVDANPLLGGYGAVEAYLPSRKIAIAVAATFTPEAFDSQGNYANSSDTPFRLIGAYMAPDDAPPMPKKG
jgi:hypothetical protein